MASILFKSASVLLVVAISAIPTWADDSPTASSTKLEPFAKTVAPFLTKYCVTCHGSAKQKGDRRFDKLTGEIRNDNALVDLQDILDQLNLGDMPPQKAKQPSNAERQAVVKWLTLRIKRHHESRKGQGRGAVLRRLNSREYRNTVRDLLALNMTMFDPTQSFPRDQTDGHLDNVGDTLVTSGYLLARYLDAAEQSVNKAMLPLSQPKPRTWIFRDGFRQQPEIDQVFRKVGEFNYMTLFDVIGADKHEGAYGPILAFKDGVPHDGFYEIRLKAEALNRLHPYDPSFLGTDRSEPLRLGIRAGNIRVGALHKPQPIEPLLAEFDLADEQKWYKVRVWLDAGYTPRFTFQNGLMDARNIWGRLVSKYAKQFPPRKNRGIVENRFYAIKYGKLPQIRIHEIEITGPIYDAWPTASQKAMLGSDSEQILASGSLTKSQIEHLVTRFASRAYRRPVSQPELDRILKIIESRKEAGQSSLQAFADGIKLVLCSPNFLYLDQSTAKQQNDKNQEGDTLSNHALAARLSYFLWSSTPDQELLSLADKRKLTDLDVLKRQVDRMLKDARSDAFIEGFLGSWLTMRDLGSTPPDRTRFRAFYHYDLGTAMRRETHLFTRHLIDKNLSIVNFLDSEFTFANKRLANLYGVKPPAGIGFEKVQLNDPRRGGLLGQASVLTVTANGIDTSPVVRGVWLLENILGTPPSPPPPDVEPLDPDIRGAKTIRDQLKKHRSVASCFDCHRKIDPLGFALENFDPIGRWRTSYDRRKPVDASGEMPSGESFKNVVQFKSILVGRKDQFSKALTSKLLAYAIGRQIELADRAHIDRLVEWNRQQGYGFRNLITQVVLSEPFRAK
jgi:cytochrome c553